VKSKISFCNSNEISLFRFNTHGETQLTPLRLKKSLSGLQRRSRDLEKESAKRISNDTNPVTGLQRRIGNQAVQRLLCDNNAPIRSASGPFSQRMCGHDLRLTASLPFQRRAGEENGDTAGTGNTSEPITTGNESGEAAQPLDTDAACAAFESMTRAAVAICRLAGEESDRCETACAKVRAHAGGPHLLSQRCNSETPEIGFKEQRKSGAACGTNADLGVGAFGLTISEEMVHYVDPYARCFLDDFLECRISRQVCHLG